LRDNLSRLRQTGAAVRCADAPTLLQTPPSAPYDIVFVDPPFPAGVWESAANALDARGWLRDGALVYVELPADANPVLPAQWSPHRQSAAGAVRYALYRSGGASVKL